MNLNQYTYYTVPSNNNYVSNNQFDSLLSFGIIIWFFLIIIPIIILLIFIINTIKQTKLLKELVIQQKYTNHYLEEMILGKENNN